jgi:hypothetical protein
MTARVEAMQARLAASAYGRCANVHGRLTMTKRTAYATAAAIFAAGSLVAVAANAQGGVKCSGVNACKGQSACKMSNSSCKGQNACKGQGFTQTTDVASCTAQGGKVIQ